MWADTLLVLERAHLLRLTTWGASSMLAGSALVAWVMVRRLPSALLLHFAVQCLAWGLVILVVAVIGWGALGMRDMDAAIRLTNRSWMNVGLSLGYAAVGLTLLLCGWRLGRRMALVGAGAGVLVQGSMLLAIELRLITSLSMAAP